MIYSYPAIFYKEDNGYTVVFRDFNNATNGSSFDEAMYMAMELLAINIHWYKENDIPFPTPSDITKINTHDECFNAKGTTIMVSCEAEEYIQSCNDKGVHCIITIPQTLFNKSVEQSLDLSKILTSSLENL